MYYIILTKLQDKFQTNFIIVDVNSQPVTVLPVIGCLFCFQTEI